ncbi:MAG: DUF3530 family protein [Ectothiorhodospiraceae bacterium]|nr:DUF3530 family protein [Ectothiorhodospiraceae bacterium]
MNQINSLYGLKYLRLSVVIFGLLVNVVMANNPLIPVCGNVVLDPAIFGGGMETVDGCLLTGAGTPSVGVVLLHGRNSSPDGPVVNELRISLQTAGYTTLSIENPAANPVTNSHSFTEYTIDVQSATPYAFPEAYARVQAAISHLQGTGVTQVVVIGFSMGSRFSAAAVARILSPAVPIIGLVGVGMYNSGGGNGIDPLDPDFTLDEVSVPVLDIYGNEDTNAIADNEGRIAAYNAGFGVSYTQLELDCTTVASTNCHQLQGLRGADTMPLEIAVNGWMACYAPLVTANCSAAPALTSDGVVTAGLSGSGGGGNLSLLALALLGIFARTTIKRRRILL